MDKSSAGAFTFAKASGNLGKSFTLSRSQLLFDVKSLSELWTLLFKSPVPMIPEVLLAEKIENEAFSKFLKDYITLVNTYDKHNSVLTDQLEIFEVENLKVIVAALSNKEQKMPQIFDLQNFSHCHYETWPDLAAITRGTSYEWLTSVSSVHEEKDIEFKLDLQLVRHIYSAINKCSGDNKNSLIKLFNAEYLIKNIVWALRLKIFYKMNNEDIISKLMFVSDKADLNDPLAGPAIKLLDLPLDEAGAWQSFSYKDYLNPYVPGEIWQVDPSWIEMTGRRKLNQLALKTFHQNPMSEASLVGWYKVKEYELNCIRTAVESLRLNIEPEEAKRAVGLQSLENF